MLLPKEKWASNKDNLTTRAASSANKHIARCANTLKVGKKFKNIGHWENILCQVKARAYCTTLNVGKLLA